MTNFSGIRRGPLVVGERVTLTDTEGASQASLSLKEGAVWHTTKGAVSHDELIGGPEGVTIKSVGGMQYLALRPLLSEYMVAMPREAAVIYPKDAAQILMWADIFPGARVLEAGVGSGRCPWPCCEPSGQRASCTPTNADSNSPTWRAATWRTSSKGNTRPGA